MAAETIPDLGTLSSSIGQSIRSNELKVAGKLLATGRGHLHQLSLKEKAYQPRYEQIAMLRNELMEPGEDDEFDAKQLLVQLLDEDKKLTRVLASHPAGPAKLSRAMLRAAAAIVLVYAQDLESDAPLDF